MRGLLLYNGYSDIPPYEQQIRRLAEEFGKRDVQIDCRKNREFLLHIEDSKVSMDSRYDFCVFLDKDIYTSIMVEKLGIPTFNCPDSIAICDDKMLTYLALAGIGIDLPDTTPGPLFYDAGMPVDEQTLRTLEERYPYPMVVKQSYGSQGRNVYLVRDRTELLDKMTELRGSKYLIQRYVRTSVGEDLRVIVIGGRAIGGMIRRSENDFRSNAALGGKTHSADVSEKSRLIAEKVATFLKLDYCGIDLLKDARGDYSIVCEVNSNAFFSSFEESTGINVAEKYVAHIIERVTCIGKRPDGCPASVATAILTVTEMQRFPGRARI